MQISNKKHVEARTQIWRFVSHASWLQLQDVAFILDKVGLATIVENEFEKTLNYSIKLAC